jgi:hypothetical protein
MRSGAVSGIVTCGAGLGHLAHRLVGIIRVILSYPGEEEGAADAQ